MKRYIFFISRHTESSTRDVLSVYRLKNNKPIALTSSERGFRTNEQAVCDIIYKTEKGWRKLKPKDLPAKLSPKKTGDDRVGISSGMNYHAVSWAYSEHKIELIHLT